MLLREIASSPDIYFIFSFSEVLLKLSLDLSSIELGHLLRASDRADTISPSGSEDNIHLLETSSLWFGEQPVDCRNNCCVQNGKDDISSPGKIRESRGSNHDNGKLG